MIVTMTARTRDPEPTAARKDPGRPPRRHDPEDRLHVSAIVAGLIDARACHIDFLDTTGGQELARWYRRQRTARQHLRH
jgi:hypothetical protein